MHVPVTRDDGVHGESPGLPAETPAWPRHDVVAAAPPQDHGGTGTAPALRTGGPVQVVPGQVVPVRDGPGQVVPVRDGPGGTRTPGLEGSHAPAVTPAHRAARGRPPQAAAPAAATEAHAGHAVLHAATAGAAVTASTAGPSAPTAADRPRRRAAVQVAVDCPAPPGHGRRRTCPRRPPPRPAPGTGRARATGGSPTVTHGTVPVGDKDVTGLTHAPVRLPPHRTGRPAAGGTVPVGERPQTLLPGPRTAIALALERRVTHTVLDPLTGASFPGAPADPTYPRVPGPPAAPDEETG